MQISNCVRKTLMCQVSTEQWILFLCHQYGVSNRDFVHLRVSFKKKQKEYNGRNLVNFLWENPHFCISVKVLLRWLSMHKFRQICTYTSCVKCKPFVCLWNMSNEDFFFLPSVLDVIYELTMFLNIHFLSWEKWRICRYLLPLLLFFFVEPLVSYKNTDTRSWMEFSFICIVF